MLEEVLCQDGAEIQHSLPICFLSDINCFEDDVVAKDELIDHGTKILTTVGVNSKSLGEFWCS
jgi:hypothetical protein